MASRGSWYEARAILWDYSAGLFASRDQVATVMLQACWMPRHVVAAHVVVSLRGPRLLLERGPRCVSCMAGTGYADMLLAVADAWDYASRLVGQARAL